MTLGLNRNSVSYTLCEVSSFTPSIRVCEAFGALKFYCLLDKTRVGIELTRSSLKLKETCLRGGGAGAGGPS